jgi:catechol 2,3-dioxygenase-like lactoylglutathione lyase family enzyme
MPIALDYTILDVEDFEASIASSRDVVGLEHGGRSGPLEVMLVTPDPAIDLREPARPAPRHLAFRFDREAFEAAFSRIRDGAVADGDAPSTPDNMRGPAPSTGVHGVTDAVYSRDPNGNLLEILTYE